MSAFTTPDMPWTTARRNSRTSNGSDGWISAVPQRPNGRGVLPADYVSFYEKDTARIPRIAGAPKRGEWQYNRTNNVVRFVFREDDSQAVTHNTGTKSSAFVSKKALQEALGRKIVGKFAFVVGEDAVYVDLDEPIQ